MPDRPYIDYQYSELLDLRRELEREERKALNLLHRPTTQDPSGALKSKITALGRGISEIDDELAARREAKRIERERREAEQLHARREAGRVERESREAPPSPLTSKLWLPPSARGKDQRT